MEQRIKIVAKEITDFLKSTNRFSKIIVFCVNIDHAEKMKYELINLNSDLTTDLTQFIEKK